MSYNELKRQIITLSTLISKVYQPSVFLLFGVIFFGLYFSPYKIFPDYLKLSEVQNIRDLLWRLFATMVGFSGLMLTVFLVVYNAFYKSVRRNTFEFVVKNPWFRALFTLFGCITLFNFLGFALINGDYNKLAVVYFLLIVSVFYVIALFPIILLGLRHSVSLKQISKLVDEVIMRDINALVDPLRQYPDDFYIGIEANKIISLKDIGVSAIKDGDWILPQKILHELSTVLFGNLKDEGADIRAKKINAFIFVCRHFSRVSIRNSDEIMVGVIFGNLLNLYRVLIKERDFSYSYENLDDFLKEFCYELIDSHDYPVLRDEMIKDVLSILKSGIKSFEFSDDELPTMLYYSIDRDKTKENKEAMKFWHFLTKSHIRTVFGIIKYSVKMKDERVYDTLNWQMQSLINCIASAKNLSQIQSESLLEELYYEFYKLVNYCIDNDWSERMDFIDNVHIVKWVDMKSERLYTKGIYFYRQLLLRLNSVKKMDYMILENFFFIGREVLSSSFQVNERTIVLSMLVEIALDLYENRYNSDKLKYEIQRQLNWLKIMYENDKEVLIAMKNSQYDSRIALILNDFNVNYNPLSFN